MSRGARDMGTTDRDQALTTFAVPSAKADSHHFQHAFPALPCRAFIFRACGTDPATCNLFR